MVKSLVISFRLLTWLRALCSGIPFAAIILSKIELTLPQVIKFVKMKMEIINSIILVEFLKTAENIYSSISKLFLLGRVGVVKEMGSYQFIGGSRGNLIIIRRI